MQLPQTDKKNLLLLASYLDICHVHANRLKMALAHIEHLHPMQPSTFMQLSDEEVSYMELLISRFSKLQDVIGSKIFPLLLNLLQEEPKGNNFLDILHQLEKLDILPSIKLWIGFRDLRNHLTHEYPEHPDIMANYSNQAIQKAQELLLYWTDLKNKILNIQAKWAEYFQ